MQLSGLLGSAVSFVIRSVFKQSGFFLVILNNKEEAAAY
jgi:transcription-repair coupling factor (superfamily II helicase)